MNVGENIHAIRVLQGLTLKDIGDSLGTSKVFVLQLEKGLRTPNLYQLVEICKVLKCTPNDILEFKEKIERSIIMNNLVMLKSDDVLTTSKVIADGTGVSHKKLKLTINKYKSAIETFGLLVSYKTESTGGRPEEIILLTEPQATFLITLLKNTEKIVMFKAELVKEFFEMRKFIMERHTDEWVESRKQSKLNRKSQTDAIKELVEYAKANGSKNANRYYSIYSKLADKVVGIKNRDETHISQLNTLSVVE